LTQDAQARNNYGTYLYQIGVIMTRLSNSSCRSTLGYDQRGMALENLGLNYLKLGDVANAEKAFKQALQVNRNSTFQC
jgi:type IV pilus assembly protein PilF